MTSKSVSWRERLQKSIADKQFQAIQSKTEEELRPGLSMAVVIASLLSLLILLTPVAVGAAGIYLMIYSGFSVVGVIFGALILLVAYFLLPNVGRLDGPVETRESMPALFQLVDGLAEKMGAPRIDKIVIEPQFNAFMTNVGYRRTRVLGIGVALWQVLDSDQRVALIGHELAHEVNNDPGRSTLIWFAEQTLQRWHDILMPDDHSEHSDAEFGFIAAVAAFFMSMAAFVVRQIYLVLYLLHMRISQRAEYYADLLGAKAAGTAAMQSLLRRMVCHSIVRSLIVRGWSTSEGSGKHLMTSLNDNIATSYGEEIERLQAEMEAEFSSVDASHPPTVYRLRFLDGHTGLTGEFNKGIADWDAIAAELEPFLDPAGKLLMDHPDLL